VARQASREETVVLSNAQGALISPDLAQNLQALDQTVGMARLTLQEAVGLLRRHDQAFDWSGIRQRMQREAQRAER